MHDRYQQQHATHFAAKEGAVLILPALQSFIHANPSIMISTPHLQGPLGAVHSILVAEHVPQPITPQDDKCVTRARGLEGPHGHTQHVWLTLHKPAQSRHGGGYSEGR